MELKLWGARFTKQTDQLVHNFNASISFDQKFYKQDINGSIAHVTMLAKQQILTDEERDVIVSTLEDIKKEIPNALWAFGIVYGRIVILFLLPVP